MAFVISRLLGPLPLICLLWLVVAVKSGIGFWRAIWVYPLIFAISIAFPTIITTYLILTKRVVSLDWPDLAQRRKYMPLITIFAVITSGVLTAIFTSPTIFHLNLVFLTIFSAMVAIWVIFNFKISGHTTIATCTFLAINLFFHLKLMWLFLLLIPIIWSRLVLKMHTFSQLAAGIILPAVISLTALLLFGWPAVP